jgi:hypothetical protein
VIFVSPGIDSLAPYLSSAPAVLGLLNGNNIVHNLTLDSMVADTIENKYTSAETETLINAGVCVISKNKNGCYIAKGVNTLQANDDIWNMDGKTTYLPTQRTVCDYISKYFKEDLENFIGADGISKSQIAARCARNWEVLYRNFDPGLFGENPDDVLENGLPYKTDKIEATSDGQGWTINIAYIPLGQTNYIGLYVQIYLSY